MSLTAFNRHVQVCLGSLLLAPLALAETVPQGLSINPFPGAQITDSKVLPQADHAVVIGLVRKVNNRLRAEREVRATGELIRVTFEIPRIHSRAEGFEHVRDQLLARPHSMLFYCEGRECGASSLWANEVLDNSRLYGPEENQAYLSVRLEEDPQRLVSVYAITRGNQRSYVHVDQFTPEEPIVEPLYPTPSTLLKLLHANGRLALPGLELGLVTEKPRAEDPEVWINLVNRMLRSDTRVRVAISGQQAPAVMQRLIDLDIRSSRLEIGQPYPETGIVIDKI
ncbi:DUF4892 domain-containing protein [Halopseudomonas salina]|uniref:DUF4892 domain-containing protein n=1 Tax=Halopseudomonas salina TaxID=1323744 RepID=A0ABQ1Q0F2_9GAMM|nr:DUF4892 domain-containing protein [Halopseudomonas salina]GGD08872.1 DUF4892 domain-containing protein [Halopseudomonas salina]